MLSPSLCPAVVGVSLHLVGVLHAIFVENTFPPLHRQLKIHPCMHTLNFRVADPYHLNVDPDPDPHQSDGNLQRGLNIKRPTIVFFLVSHETSLIIWIGEPAPAMQS